MGGLSVLDQTLDHINMEPEAPQYQLNAKDVKSIAVGLLITLAGAGLTYLTTVVGRFDFGPYTPLIVVVWAAFVNITRKFIDGEQTK